MHATRRLISGRVVAKDIVDQIVMTMNAVFFQNPQTDWSKPDRFREILQRETFRVPEAILGLDPILWDHRVRDMAVAARCHGVVTGVLPAVILLPHDMTVDA